MNSTLNFLLRFPNCIVLIYLADAKLQECLQ